jgi:hypothetical protein
MILNKNKKNGTHHAVCVYLLVRLRMTEPIFMKLGMYVIAGHLSGVLHKSLMKSVCVSACVNLISLLGNGSVKERYRGNDYIRNNRRIGWGVVSYVVRVVIRGK